MSFELPRIVSEKTGTVLKRIMFNPETPNSRYLRRVLVPGQDTFLSQKGVNSIYRDSDDKLIKVYDKNAQLAISGTPQEVRPLFQMLKKVKGLKLGDIAQN